MKGLPGGGMRALPGPSGGGGGRGIGGGYGAEIDMGGQPGLWAIPVAGFVLFTGAAWLVDLVTAGWCHVEGAGCVPTHYLAALVHVYVVGALCVALGGAALVVAAIGYRRRWHVAVAWTALVLAAWAVRRIRAARARRAAVRRAAGTAVRVVVLGDDDVVVTEEVPPRALAAERVTPAAWSGQPVPPVRNGVDTRR